MKNRIFIALLATGFSSLQAMQSNTNPDMFQRGFTNPTNLGIGVNTMPPTMQNLNIAIGANSLPAIANTNVNGTPLEQALIAAFHAGAITENGQANPQQFQTEMARLEKILTENPELVNMRVGYPAQALLIQIVTDPTLVELLLKFNADVNATGTHKWTALHSLMQHLCDVEYQKYSIRFYPYKKTLLMLLAAGADINMQDDKGNTALMNLLTCVKSEESVKDALEFTKILNKQGRFKEQMEKLEKNESYVKLLEPGLRKHFVNRVMPGINATLKNNKGQTIVDIAKEREQQIKDPALKKVFGEIISILSMKKQ